MGQAVRRQQQYHYRSVAVEIAPGRYARDGWVLEPWFQRDALKRSTEGKIKPKPAPAPERKPGHNSRGPMAGYKPADMPMQRGMYERIGMQDFHANGRFSVLARCTGPHCGGRTRLFAARDWIQKRAVIRGCNTCICQLRKQQRREAKRKMGIAWPRHR